MQTGMQESEIKIQSVINIFRRSVLFFVYNNIIILGSRLSSLYHTIYKKKIKYLHNNRIKDKCSGPPSLLPVNTINHCVGSTLIPYFNKFSRNNRNPPIDKRRKPQFTNPVKSLNPDDHENNESLGL